VLEDVGGDVDLGDLDPGRIAVADVSPLSSRTTAGSRLAAFARRAQNRDTRGPGTTPGGAMTYLIINDFEGGTKEQYEAVANVVHPPDDGMPAGQTQRYAGPIANGWVVVAVWESKEAWEKFRDGTLMPGMQEVGDSGFAGPPKTTEFEVEVDVTG
jgi:heme-degrading monooxygenase HmoA